MQANLVLTINRGISVSDISIDFDEPRIRDLVLAEALGMANRHDLRTLIKRHTKVLKTFGELVYRDDEKLPQGGRPGKSFYLNKRQAIYITAKSDTPTAAMLTVQMVEVFDKHLNGDLVHVKPYTRSKPEIKKSKIDLEDGQYVVRIKDGTIFRSREIEEGYSLISDAHWQKVFNDFKELAPTKYIM